MSGALFTWRWLLVGAVWLAAAMAATAAPPEPTATAPDEVDRDSAQRHGTEAALLRLEGALRAKLARAAGSGDFVWVEALRPPDATFLLWSPRPAKAPQGDATYRVAIDMRTRWYYVVKADGAREAQYFGPLDEVRQGDFVDVLGAAAPLQTAAAGGKVKPSAAVVKAAKARKGERPASVAKAGEPERSITAKRSGKAGNDRTPKPGSADAGANTAEPTKVARAARTAKAAKAGNKVAAAATTQKAASASKKPNKPSAATAAKQPARAESARTDSGARDGP